MYQSLLSWLIGILIENNNINKIDRPGRNGDVEKKKKTSSIGRTITRSRIAVVVAISEHNDRAGTRWREEGGALLSETPTEENFPQRVARGRVTAITYLGINGYCARRVQLLDGKRKSAFVLYVCDRRKSVFKRYGYAAKSTRRPIDGREERETEGFGLNG